MILLVKEITNIHALIKVTTETSNHTKTRDLDLLFSLSTYAAVLCVHQLYLAVFPA